MFLYNKDNIDLKIEISFFSGTGAGGQHRNKKKQGVRLIHKSTGIMVTNNDTRSKKINKESAIKEMCNRLNKYYTQKNEELFTNEFQINKKIVKTYNQKRGTCKDHRSGLVQPIDKKTCILEPDNLDLMIERINKNNECREFN